MSHPARQSSANCLIAAISSVRPDIIAPSGSLVYLVQPASVRIMISGSVFKSDFWMRGDARDSHDHLVQQTIETQVRAVAVAQIPRSVLTTAAPIIPMVDHEFQGARVVVQHQSCDNCLSMVDLGCYCTGDDSIMPWIDVDGCD